MENIGIIANLEKDEACKLAKQIEVWLKNLGLSISLDDRIAKKISIEGKPLTKEDPPDFVIVLGGDGTLLDTARKIAQWGVPLVGVNLGQLGFLTEIEANEIFTALEDILDGKYWLEKRMMLEAKVRRNGKEIGNCCALNDVVLAKSGFSRMLRLEASVDDEYVDTYLADGLIVATPTGSTAYSLSAGGPLIVPGVEVMLLTPICSHSLGSRSLIISPEQVTDITLKSKQAQAMLTVDGQHGFELQEGDSISVYKAPYKAQLLRHKQKSFFAITREKLNKGGRKGG